MCSANADGASATIICSKKKAKQFTTNAIRLVGWVHGGPPYVPGEPKIRESNLPELGRQLYKRAGIGPQDVGVFQCHNAFSPGELYHMEDLQLCPVGEGGPFIWEGNTEITGKIPINTDGGLVGRGHPLGATGGAMIAELIAQMRGQAGPRQIPTPPKVALCHNDGEGGSNVLVLTR
jgi:acetyl-CoA acetyltransferase